MIVRCAALALAIAIARAVGSAGYGQYTFALAYAGTYAAFADFGTSRYLTRAIAHDRVAAPNLLTTAFLAKGVVFLPSLAAAAALTLQLPVEDRALVLLFVGAGAVQSLAGLMRAVLFGVERMDLDTVSRLLERAIAIGGSLAALLLGHGLIGVGVSVFFAGTVDLSVVSVLAARRVGWRTSSASLRRAVTFLRGALPLGLFGLILSLYAGLPLYLLKTWQGAAASGEYGAAATPILALIPPAVTVASASLPVFTRLALTDPVAMRATFGVLLRIFCLAGLAVAPGVMIVANAMVVLVYGPTFAASGAALRILAVGLLGVFPTQVSINVLVATGRQRILLWIDAVALVWQLAIDLIAIPRAGVAGAALGTASAEILVAVLFCVAAARAAGLPRLTPLLRALPATAGLAAVAIPLLHAVGLAPAIAGGAIAYMVLLVVFQAVTKKDLLEAHTALQRRPAA